MNRLSALVAAALALPIAAPAQQLPPEAAAGLVREALTAYGCTLSEDDEDLAFGFVMGWAASEQGLRLDGPDGTAAGALEASIETGLDSLVESGDLQRGEDGWVLGGCAVEPSPPPEDDLATIAGLEEGVVTSLAAEALTAFGCRVPDTEFDAFERFAMARISEAIGVTLEGTGSPVYEALFDRLGEGFDQLENVGRLSEEADAMVLQGCVAPDPAGPVEAPAGGDPVALIDALSDEALIGALVETFRQAGCVGGPEDEDTLLAMFYEQVSALVGIEIFVNGPADTIINDRMGDLAPRLLEDGTLVEEPSGAIRLVDCVPPPIEPAK